MPNLFFARSADKLTPQTPAQTKGVGTLELGPKTCVRTIPSELNVGQATVTANASPCTGRGKALPLKIKGSESGSGTERGAEGTVVNSMVNLLTYELP